MSPAAGPGGLSLAAENTDSKKDSADRTPTRLYPAVFGISDRL
jgi:hypothetical protein